MDNLTFFNTANNQTPIRCKSNEDFKYILLPICYSLVFIIGLLLNLTALYFILFRIRRWKPKTIYMTNLIVCDLMYLFTLPFQVYYYIVKNDWPFFEFFCKLLRFLFYTNLYGSILFLTCISVLRFVGICYPMRFMGWVSTPRACLVSVIIWTILLVFQAPVLYFSRTNAERCYDTTTQDLYVYFLIYSSAIMVLFFVVPFCLVLVCNGMMMRKLSQPSMAGSATSSLRAKKKSIRIIIVVLLVFILCFLPFHLTRTVHYFFRYFDLPCSVRQYSNVPYKMARLLVTANGCIDPILYFMSGEGFQQTIRRKDKQAEQGEEGKRLSTSL
ncbi:P2Y purinoceptor 2-like [Trichomycterus rosablanca]|uniref:P2Y purinoceptor 2-like n=1 Tax=Trichomycterus rosablanca TaxID=2290929 RepID=UPI002F353650